MKKNNSIEKENNPSNWFWLLALIVFLVFIYFIPNEIAYPKYKFLSWIMLFLILVVLPYLVFKTLKSLNQNTSQTKAYGICALSILVVGSTSAIFNEYREEKELMLNGKVTECFVYDRKKSKNDWLINCKYFVNNTEFITYYHTDEKNKYKIGDTIKLIYNKEFPRMYKIEFYK